jgi:hypothetical protein
VKNTFPRHLHEGITEDVDLKKNIATGKDSQVLNCDPKAKNITPTDNIVPLTLYISQNTKTKMLIVFFYGRKERQRSTNTLKRRA